MRAFGRQEEFTRAFLAQTDRYNRNQMFEWALDRWLNVRSDAVGALVGFVVGILSLAGGLSPGLAGFLLSSGLEVTSRILYVVRQREYR